MELAMILGGLTIAELIAIIVLARMLGTAKADVRISAKENKALRRALNEMGKPAPTADDPDALRKFLL